MDDSPKELYLSYRREFRRLHGEGCLLCYPENEEIAPEELARRIVCDPGATYMRDPCYSEKGGLVRVCFQRVEVEEHPRGEGGREK